jgi:hypothetical protein
VVNVFLDSQRSAAGRTIGRKNQSREIARGNADQRLIAVIYFNGTDRHNRAQRKCRPRNRPVMSAHAALITRRRRGGIDGTRIMTSSRMIRRLRRHRHQLHAGRTRRERGNQQKRH